MSDMIATRHAYGEALMEIGGANEKVVALDADVSTCTMSCFFGDKNSDRFVNVGIAEANMIGMAAGMATLGLIPFAHSFAMFTAGRGFDQIRNSIAYPKLNVKIVGTHAGLTIGEDGATHQCLEDIGLMRTIPGMTIICPTDGNETHAAVKAIVDHKGPTYLRLGRLAVETVTVRSDYKFEIGKAFQMKDGSDATIIAVGMMVQLALKAADRLADQGVKVRVLDMHTIKPLDLDAIYKAVDQTGAIVTAEEHNILCGLGGAVAEVVAEYRPVPVLRVGVEDSFGKSGAADPLLDKYGLTCAKIIEKVKKAIEMKKRT
jgi:transketolase